MSWAGVIFSAPVPNSMVTYSSVMIGILRPDQRNISKFAMKMPEAFIIRMNADSGITHYGFRTNGGDGDILFCSIHSSA